MGVARAAPLLILNSNLKAFYTNQSNIKFSFQLPASCVGFSHLVFEMCHDFLLVIKYKNKIKFCYT